MFFFDSIQFYLSGPVLLHFTLKICLVLHQCRTALHCGLAHHPNPARIDLRAGMAELVDAPDLGSGIERCAGSSPVPGTFQMDP